MISQINLVYPVRRKFSSASVLRSLAVSSDTSTVHIAFSYSFTLSISTAFSSTLHKAGA